MKACRSRGVAWTVRSARQHDVAPEEVFAGRVDDVQEQRQRRDEQQVTVGENQAEPALAALQLLRRRAPPAASRRVR